MEFILEPDKFRNSALFLMDKSITFTSGECDVDRNFKPILVHSAKPLVQNVDIKFSEITERRFNSSYIQTRLRIQVPKKLFQLRLHTLRLRGLILHFDGYRQIHIESSVEMSFLRMMQVKSRWRDLLHFTINDLIFIYFDASNRHLILHLMLGDFIYQGEDISRSCMIWSVQKS